MFALELLEEDNIEIFKRDMQEAFQKGAEQEFGHTDEVVGGVVVVIDRETNHNTLSLLYVKNGCQNRGIGLRIWKAIEELYPETEVWETVTPYFIHSVRRLLRKKQAWIIHSGLKRRTLADASVQLYIKCIDPHCALGPYPASVA